MPFLLVIAGVCIAAVVVTHFVIFTGLALMALGSIASNGLNAGDVLAFVMAGVVAASIAVTSYCLARLMWLEWPKP